MMMTMSTGRGRLPLLNLSMLGLLVSSFFLLSISDSATEQVGIESEVMSISNPEVNVVNPSNNSPLLMHKLLLVPPPTQVLRFGEETPCSKDDIMVQQGPSSPLPSGIPTFTVEIINTCVTGCTISNIHLSCGWFSSATLVDPNLFKRVSYDDCLVNGGEPLASGEALAFKYANTRSYPLSVSSVDC